MYETLYGEPDDTLHDRLIAEAVQRAEFEEEEFEQAWAETARELFEARDPA